MSKTKYGKFNDSGNMLPFYVASVAVAVDQIMKVRMTFISTLKNSVNWSIYEVNRLRLKNVIHAKV